MSGAIGIYLHIPFCRQKCRYCDFPSYAGMEAKQEAYVTALIEEIKRYGKELDGQEVHSVFLGGGTPTVLPLPLLERLMAAVFDCFSVSADAEITTEANPGTLDREKVRGLRDMGFHRISMGVQAWQNRHLQKLGRIHTIEEFLENYHALREAGFSNLNVDLMFALPEQTMADWQETLEKITELEPEHISAYSLILEEGTPFYEEWQKGRLPVVSEELDREMYWRAVEFLAKKGYEQYEISNFAKAGYQSRHNRIYWQAEEYLGLGLGAHSYWRGVRFHNTYDLQAYLAKAGKDAVAERETVTPQDALEEFMFLGLRLTEGISFRRFRERFGKEMKGVYGEQIKRLKTEGLLEETESGIRLSGRGIDVSNLVFQEFLLD